MRKVCRMFANNLDALRIRKDFPSSFLALPRNLKGTSIMGYSCGSAGKESACNVEDLGSIPGLGRSPGEGKSYTLTPVFWPGEFHGLYSLWGHKSRTPLSDFHSWEREGANAKGTAAQSMAKGTT